MHVAVRIYIPIPDSMVLCFEKLKGKSKKLLCRETRTQNRK